MSEPVFYWVDERDFIVRVNEAWDVFATENDAPELTGGRVVGRPLWAFIGEPATRHLYAGLLPRVRAGVTTRFTLRCDSPTMRQRVQVIVSPGHDGIVQFESAVIGVELRPEQSLLRRSLRRGRGTLIICSWCQRVSVLDDWLEVEEAIAQLGVFEDDAPPALSHGICPDCTRRLETMLQPERTPASEPEAG